MALESDRSDLTCEGNEKVKFKRFKRAVFDLTHLAICKLKKKPFLLQALRRAVFYNMTNRTDSAKCHWLATTILFEKKIVNKNNLYENLIGFCYEDWKWIGNLRKIMVFMYRKENY